LSGLVDVLGAAESGPLVSGAPGPPGVVEGTLPSTRGRSRGAAAVPGAAPIAALLSLGPADVGPGVGPWAAASPALTASKAAAIASFMNELRLAVLSRG
jgi:hypothetical protein